MSFLSFRKWIVSGCLAFSAPLVSSGFDAVPFGAETPLSGPLLGDQVAPALAAGAGGACVAWEDNSVSALGTRVVIKRLDGDFNPVGTPIVASSAFKSKTAGNQEKPQIAMFPTGESIVVWQGGVPAKQQIYARLFNASGAPVKSDIRLGNRPKNNQVNPAVAAGVGGTALTVWATYDADGHRQGVFGQLLSATGAKVGAEFQINEFTLNNQRNPSVAALADGRFVVAWVSELQRNPSSSVDIFARIYNADGTAAGNEFPVSASLTNACANPVVAAAAGGGFAVAWSQRDDVGTVLDGNTGTSGRGLSNSSWDIYGRVFSASGSAAGAPFRINSTSYGDQYVPRLTASGAGFVAVWTSLGQDGSREGIYGRAFDSEGEFEAPEFQVNTTTISRQIQPAVASNGQDRAVVVWSSVDVGSGFDLLLQQYTTGE